MCKNFHAEVLRVSRGRMKDALDNTQVRPRACERELGHHPKKCEASKSRGRALGIRGWRSESSGVLVVEQRAEVVKMFGD